MSSPMLQQSFYSVGGTVQAGGGIYLTRAADDELLDLCRAGAFSYILTARQMGKSSLVVSAAERLVAEGVKSVYIDLAKIGGGKDVTAEQWYLGLLALIKSRLKLRTDVIRWWKDRAHLSYPQRFTDFVEQVLLAEVAEPIVIFIDEIDTTLGLDFTDDFFAAIRYFYTNRAQTPDFKRLSFALIGVATPSDLIRNPRRTPFNIGQRVDLTDFTFEEALPLAGGLNLPREEAEQVLRWVFKWTSGHPYLTQRLCLEITSNRHPYWTEADVDRVVADTFFGAMSKQDNNLQFVRDMLTKRAPDVEGVLTTYQEIHSDKRPVRDEEQSLVKSHLKLSGVVRREGIELQTRNRIYETVFDDQWVKEHLPVNWRKRFKYAASALLAILLILSPATAIYAWKNNELALKNRELENALSDVRKARDEALKASEAEREGRTRAQEAALEAQKQRDIASAARKTADKQRQIAVERSREAEKEREEANLARDSADTSAREMGRQRLIADEQRKLAEANAAEADRQRNLAQSRELAANSSLQIQADPDLSLTLADQAIQKAYTSQAEDALRQVLLETTPMNSVLRGHSDSVRSAAYSPDGKFIVSASSDRTARVWDAATHQSVAELKGHSDSVLSAAYSPDGKFIVTASDDRTARVYPRITFMPFDEVLKLAHRLSPRELTPEERERYLPESPARREPRPR